MHNGERLLNNTKTSRVRLYNQTNKYYLLIDNGTMNDSGVYTIDVDGVNKSVKILIDNIFEKKGQNENCITDGTRNCSSKYDFPYESFDDSYDRSV